jgi:hypothetical protein
LYIVGKESWFLVPLIWSHVIYEMYAFV